MQENEIKHNVPIEVTELQYNMIRTRCTGIVAHRVEEIDGVKKYYIKIMLKKYIKLVSMYLN